MPTIPSLSHSQAPIPSQDPPAPADAPAGKLLPAARPPAAALPANSAVESALRDALPAARPLPPPTIGSLLAAVMAEPATRAGAAGRTSGGPAAGAGRGSTPLARVPVLQAPARWAGMFRAALEAGRGRAEILAADRSEIGHRLIATMHAVRLLAGFYQECEQAYARYEATVDVVMRVLGPADRQSRIDLEAGKLLDQNMARARAAAGSADALCVDLDSLVARLASVAHADSDLHGLVRAAARSLIFSRTGIFARGAAIEYSKYARQLAPLAEPDGTHDSPPNAAVADEARRCREACRGWTIATMRECHEYCRLLLAFPDIPAGRTDLLHVLHEAASAMHMLRSLALPIPELGDAGSGGVREHGWSEAMEQATRLHDDYFDACARVCEVRAAERGEAGSLPGVGMPREDMLHLAGELEEISRRFGTMRSALVIQARHATGAAERSAANTVLEEWDCRRFSLDVMATVFRAAAPQVPAQAAAQPPAADEPAQADAAPAPAAARGGTVVPVQQILQQLRDRKSVV